MKHAINELEITLDLLKTNEPIHRAEGKTEQADLCTEKIRDLEQAIAVLKEAVTPSVGENRPLTKISGLSFPEALEAFKQGKKVERPVPPRQTVYGAVDSVPMIHDCFPTFADMIATDWQIVE